MEILKVTEEMRAKLRAPLNTAALKAHPTKTFLTSINPIFVVERLNDVFGVGSWRLKNTHIASKGTMEVIQVDLSIPAYGIELSCFGGNDNGGDKSKNYDMGDAYKGAVTDGLTKICSWLEIGIDVYKGIKPGNNKNDNAEQEKKKAAYEAQKLADKAAKEKAEEEARQKASQSNIVSFPEKTEVVISDVKKELTEQEKMIAAIESARNRDELKNVAKIYPGQYGKNPEFKTALDKKADEISKASLDLLTQELEKVTSEEDVLSIANKPEFKALENTKYKADYEELTSDAIKVCQFETKKNLIEKIKLANEHTLKFLKKQYSWYFLHDESIKEAYKNKTEELAKESEKAMEQASEEAMKNIDENIKNVSSDLKVAN